ncbi:hypothetical protein HCB37_04065 [Listeria booriae]|uniref:phage tail spike protein n=1 Tax=Listeria booriae TaxID=1552123 RepID=UPI001623FF35|nr:phage tail spike protein [Listeria booriae]MBC2048199.1 hypothetical protein [Listeria booriae]MBC2263688.1 hypothetical protein [Listeria booriae]
MIPVLYDRRETNFTKNGQGLLKDTLSAVVDETLNGPCELELLYPIDSRLYSKIGEESIFKVTTDDAQTKDKAQLFRAYNPVKQMFDSQILVKAKHITNDLAFNFVENFKIENATPGAALTKLFQSTSYLTKFTGTSDITTQSNTELIRKNPLECIAGTEGSFLDVWGGELERDNFQIRLLKRRGRDNVARILYRKNLTGLEMDVNTDSVITRIYPFAMKANASGVEQEIILPEKYIDSAYINNYSFIRILPVDYSQDETVTDVNTLRNAAKNYFKTTKIDEPDINVKVEFEPLWQTKEYEKYANLERVVLGDTVTVYHPKLKINITAKVVRTRFNVITERYESIELGSVKADFTDNFKKDIQNVLDQVPSQDWMNDKLQEIGDSIQGANGGSIYTFPTFRPSTMYFMDTEDVNTAKRVMVMNREGIAFYQNGITGTPKTAWSIDGTFIADFIGAGTLRAINIEGVTIKGSAGYFDTLYSDYMPGLPAPQYREILRMGGGDGFSLKAKRDTSLYPAMQVRLNTNGDLGLAIEAVNENTGAVNTDKVIRISPWAGVETPFIQSTGWCSIGADATGKVASIDRTSWDTPTLKYVPHVAASFQQGSSALIKQDIEKFVDSRMAEKYRATEMINTVEVFSYRLKQDVANSQFEKTLGFIAEMLPPELRADDMMAMDMQKTIMWLWQYARENEAEKKALEKRVSDLEEMVYALINKDGDA